MDLLDVCCKSRELWDGVLSGMELAILVTDVDGRILMADSAIEKVLGFTSEELAGQDFSIILTAQDLTYMYPNILHMARRKESFKGEIMLKRKPGELFIAYMTTRTCRHLEFGIDMVVVSIRDISSLKEQEKCFKEHHYNDLVKVADGIAHELRNPLMGIGGFVNRLFKLYGDVPDHRAYYEHIMTNLHKIESLVKKVEFFARIPKPNLSREYIDELVAEALGAFAKRLEAQGVKIELGVEHLELFLDRNLAVRVFTILIENSLDVLPMGGTISFRVDLAENECIIYVSDTGQGISDSDLPFIFNPFFSTKASGAGIDLATVKRVMELHEGKVLVISRQQEGATFALHFPMERRRRIRVAHFAEGEKMATKMAGAGDSGGGV
jgi:PAS domain S-box-containing protein